VATLESNDGLPPGTYQVYFASVTNWWVGANDQLVEEFLIDPKYMSPETSGITVEINSKNRVFDFELERFQRR